MDIDTFWGWTATDWTAVTSLLTGGLLAAAVAAALYAARQVKIARESTEEARRAQAEASRPYVIVNIEASPVGPPLFDLVVSNIGRRPALNVSIGLDPAPIRADEIAGYELAKAKMLTQPIAMIAPGQEMRVFYDNHAERKGRDKLPTGHQVSLKYTDSSGHGYEETSVIDINAMQGAAYTSVKTIHHIGKHLAEIQQTLKSASIFGRNGSIQVDAAVETRAERRQRVAEEQAERKATHQRVVDALLPYGDVHVERSESSTPPAEHEQKRPGVGSALAGVSSRLKWVLGNTSGY